MSKLKLPNGQIYRYRMIPLFPGVKQINKGNAADNLRILKHFFDKHHIKFQLAAGTLLGVIRENDFISHDEDIDLAFLDEDRERVLNLLPELRSIGFELCRFDRRDLYSIMRNGDYIDLYFFHPYSTDLSICSGWVIKTSYLFRSMTIEFKNEAYLIPQNYIEYLECEYGQNWKIPAVWHNYNKPRHKIMLFNIKEKIKEYIPRPIFKFLARRAEQKMIEKSLNNLRRIGYCK